MLNVTLLSTVIHFVSFQHSDVISCIENREDTVAFLDLAWDGSFKGRIHIRLSPDTPLAKQFRILCTGQLGPTYAHTKFIAYGNFEKINEFIRGGDYEYNDGKGGKSVVQGIDLDEPVYSRKSRAGGVWANKNVVRDRGAQFNITTGLAFNWDCLRVFGQVEDGMDVLEDAIIRMQSVKDIEIMDCGVVLPL